MLSSDFFLNAIRNVEVRKMLFEEGYLFQLTGNTRQIRQHSVERVNMFEHSESFGKYVELHWLLALYIIFLPCSN